MLLANIVTVLGGILAASGIIISKRPDARELIERLVPYKGGIGVIMALLGCFQVFGLLFSVDNSGIAPIAWILSLLIASVNLGLGFLLGFDLISEYLLEKNEKAEEKGLQVREKLGAYQSKLGIGAIIIGLLSIIF